MDGMWMKSCVFAMIVSFPLGVNPPAEGLSTQADRQVTTGQAIGRYILRQDAALRAATEDTEILGAVM